MDDMDDSARVHRAAFDERLPWLASLHTPAEDRAFFRSQVFEACEMWGVFEGGVQAGFIAYRKGWIDHLYVLPRAQGSGLGSRLLDQAKQSNRSLQLWTFQRNSGARAFYERRGFDAVRLTDGSGNDEKEPDVLYRWKAG